MKHASDLVRVWLSCITNETKKLSKLAITIARCFAATHQSVTKKLKTVSLMIKLILKEAFLFDTDHPVT